MADVNNDFTNLGDDEEEFNENSGAVVTKEKKKGVKFNSGKIGLFTGVLIVIGILYYSLSSIFSNSSKKQFESSNSASMTSIPTPKTKDPTDLSEVDQLVVKEMEKKVESKLNDKGVGVVIPQAVHLVDKESKIEEQVPDNNIPIEVVDTKTDLSRKKSLYNKSYSKDDSEYITLSREYLKRIEEQINDVRDSGYLNNIYSISEVSMQYSAPVSIVNEPVFTSEVNGRNINYPHIIPYLNVLPAVMILGHNSDLGKEMIVEMLTGDYRGARLFGRVTNSRYYENAYMQFDKMVYKDNIYQIRAIAVDPNTNIPAIDGKVKKHMIHNIVYGLGSGFLSAFAEARRLQGVGGVSIPGLGIVGNSVANSDALIESQALDAAGRTLSSIGSYREPTFTKKAYEGVGVVFLPERNVDSNNSDDVAKSES